MSNHSGEKSSSSALFNEDEEEKNVNSKKSFSTLNSRITSPLIIKRQQTMETKIANNQAYDEIHDVQPKHSSNKKFDERVEGENSDDLMQSNYYDPKRFSTRMSSERGMIDINVEDYKKTISGTSTNPTTQRSPPFGQTSESIQEGIAQSAGILLESQKNKIHQQAVIDYFPKDENDEEDRTNSSSSSSDDDEDDEDDQSHSTIPYQKLTNDDDEAAEEEEDRPPTESSSLMSKKLSQTYGTQSTSQRNSYLANNGYNSHGSSIGTKSSSDNSGSIRTNSGSENEEESDEEHYNNSTLEKTSSAHSAESTRKTSGKNDGQHGLVPRFKHTASEENEDPLKKSNNAIPTPPASTLNENSKRSNQTTSTSSQGQRTTTERAPHNSTRSRGNKKRKQSQQQELIRTELIPGHRGDLDVDELVMFIDGNSVHSESNSTKSTTRKKSRKTTKIPSIIDDQRDQSGSEDQPDRTDLPQSSTGRENNGPSTRSQSWYEQTRQASLNDEEEEEEMENSFASASTSNFQSNSVNISEPFVTVKHRRRSMKERRNEATPTPTAVPQPKRLALNNDKRRYPSNTIDQRSSPRSSSSNVKSSGNPNLPPPPPPPAAPSAPPASQTTSTSVDPPKELCQSSARLSSQSSTSSLSSLMKKNSKTPAVVFCNKSINVELNDVSFGFDIDPIPAAAVANPSSSSTVEPEKNSEPVSTTNEERENSPKDSAPKPARDPNFYSGSDIRPHHRPYPHPSQSIAPPPFIDPLVPLIYNPTRFPPYSTPTVAYMNVLRPPYLPAQAQYVFLPSSYPTVVNAENPSDESSTIHRTSETNTPAEHLLGYPAVSNDSAPNTSKPSAPLTSIYPPAMFYPRLAANPPPIFSSPAAYFQPISSSSLYVETKLDAQDLEHDNHSYEHPSAHHFHSKEQLASTSSDIMSNALQLVYSQQRRNAQTDRFNLDDLTAYLALKWSETIDHYEQGDTRILLVDHQH